jgi:hypothetical protein
MLSNLLFYLKNLIFNYRYTPKRITRFVCFICRDIYTFPITSKDYLLCNECFETMAEDNV